MVTNSRLTRMSSLKFVHTIFYQIPPTPSINIFVAFKNVSCFYNFRKKLAVSFSKLKRISVQEKCHNLSVYEAVST